MTVQKLTFRSQMSYKPCMKAGHMGQIVIAIGEAVNCEMSLQSHIYNSAYFCKTPLCIMFDTMKPGTKLHGIWVFDRNPKRHRAIKSNLWKSSENFWQSFFLSPFTSLRARATLINYSPVKIGLNNPYLIKYYTWSFIPFSK